MGKIAPQIEDEVQPTNHKDIEMGCLMSANNTCTAGDSLDNSRSDLAMGRQYK